MGDWCPVNENACLLNSWAVYSRSCNRSCSCNKSCIYGISMWAINCPPIDGKILCIFLGVCLCLPWHSFIVSGGDDIIHQVFGGTLNHQHTGIPKCQFLCQASYFISAHLRVHTSISYRLIVNISSFQVATQWLPSIFFTQRTLA